MGADWDLLGNTAGCDRLGLRRIRISPGRQSTPVHAHFGGRPLMSAMLHELLRYMKNFPDVWFARHDEVARWALRQTQ